MEKARLPKSQTELPQLFGAVTDNNEVKWCLDNDEIVYREDYMDGTNWYQVWMVNDVVHVSATMWFHARGHFSMALTDETPDHCVQLAAYAANMAVTAHEGEIKWEKLT